MSKNPKKGYKVQDKWFSDAEFKFFLQKDHPENNEHNLYCTLCNKDINIEYQGQTNVTRHVKGSAHKKMVESKRNQRGIDSLFMKQSDHLDMHVRRVEVKVTGFLAEHNVPIAVADHLGPLFKDIFPDSKIAKNYACGKTKTACISNRAIKPDSQKNLIDNIKNNSYSISTDGSNDIGLKKMNPVTVRLFNINQRMVVTQFSEMWLSSSSDSDGIFAAIDKV